jgi:hypothetical protein
VGGCRDRAGCTVFYQTTSIVARIRRFEESLAVRRICFACIVNNLRLRQSGDENAEEKGMSTSPLSNLSSSYLQSFLNNALQSAGLNTSTTANSTGVAAASSAASSSQLSPFAQMLSTLQQLQQSNPTEYQQVTQQIATNLQTAAQTATSEGNTTAASQLTELSTDFTNASKSGQLPNIQDLAQAIGGGHHHHHHSHAASSDSDSDSTTNGSSTTSASSSTSTASSANQTLSQMLAAFEANTTQNNALNPMAIIANTLSSAGITGS